MVMFTTTWAVVLRNGDTFLPRPPNFKKIKNFMVAKSIFHPFFPIIKKNLLPLFFKNPHF
jgi:hypothetical protein